MPVPGVGAAGSLGVGAGVAGGVVGGGAVCDACVIGRDYVPGERTGGDDGDGGEDLSVSISLGVAMWVEGADASWLMQAADSALYDAKRSGRNCYRLAA